MDEAQQLCTRMLGAGASADDAAAQARAQASADRVGLLAAAARACRERAEPQQDQRASEMPDTDEARGGIEVPGEDPASIPLLATVSGEMAAACARLPERQREALALRELLRLSYAQISSVMGIEPTAVAPLLARARLRLRSERRGDALASACPERDRALGIVARRQDSEPVTGDDDDWLLAHLGSCEECDRAHAAMLEASVCYRAWPASVSAVRVGR